MNKKKVLKFYLRGYEKLFNILDLDYEREIDKKISDIGNGMEESSKEEFFDYLLNKDDELTAIHKIVVLYNLTRIRKALNFFVIITTLAIIILVTLAIVDATSTSSIY